VARLSAALLFWIAVGLIQKFNWDLGIYKALVLLAVLVATPFVTWTAARRRPRGERQATSVLAAAAVVLLAAQAVYALWQLRHPSLTDIATTTLAAGKQLLAGTNPYAASVDVSASGTTAQARFAGYKYLPVMIAAYLPLGAPMGERGVVLTNLLLQFAAVALVFRLAQAIAGGSAGWIAALLYLSLPLVPFQLFAKGVTDLVAVLPLLLALVLLEHKPALAGFCIGLSMSAKLLPGLLLLPCCVPATARARLVYAAGFVLGLLPVLPFLLWAPQPFIDNIFLFNLVRPPDSTSWLLAAPALAADLAEGLTLGAFLAVAAYILIRPPSLGWRTGLGVVLVLAALLCAPAAHHNYQLWWLLLMAALLGAALAPQRSRKPETSWFPRAPGAPNANS
jgi:Glycosyltransferase family 87